MSDQSDNDERDKLMELLARAEWDSKIFKEIFGPTRCFKCGSVEVGVEEVIDEFQGLILQCENCPEIDEHH